MQKLIEQQRKATTTIASITKGEIPKPPELKPRENPVADLINKEKIYSRRRAILSTPIPTPTQKNCISSFANYSWRLSYNN